MRFDTKKYDMKIRRATIVEKVWGWEEHFVNKEYCGKRLHVNENFHLSLHMHAKKTETFLIEKGRALLEIVDVSNAKSSYYLLEEGDIFDLPTWTPHLVVAIDGDTDIIEFSTTDEVTDSKRFIPGGKFTDEEILKKLENVQTLKEEEKEKAKLLETIDLKLQEDGQFNLS